MIDYTLLSDGSWTHSFDLDGNPSTLEVQDYQFDLSNPSQAQKAFDFVLFQRQALKDGNLDNYEGKSTDFGGGGRTALLYDQLRAQMAVDFHKGKHDMSWAEQSTEADRIRSIRAIQTLR